MKHPFITGSDDADKILLSLSRGSDQISHFDPPENCNEINENNAHILFTLDSWLFNDTYERAMRRYLEKQMKANQDEVKEDIHEMEESEVKDMEFEKFLLEWSIYEEPTKAHAQMNQDNHLSLKENRKNQLSTEGLSKRENEMMSKNEDPAKPIKWIRSVEENKIRKQNIDSCNKNDKNLSIQVYKDEVSAAKLNFDEESKLNNSNKLGSKFKVEDDQEEQINTAKLLGFSIIDINTLTSENTMTQGNTSSKEDELNNLRLNAKTKDNSDKEPDLVNKNEDLQKFGFEIVYFNSVKLLEEGYYTRRTEENHIH